MENPASHGKAERIVQGAINDHYESIKAGTYGVSMALRITDALREAGLLKEEDARKAAVRERITSGRPFGPNDLRRGE